MYDYINIVIIADIKEAKAVYRSVTFRHGLIYFSRFPFFFSTLTTTGLSSHITQRPNIPIATHVNNGKLKSITSRNAIITNTIKNI
jgi:hypothetical protein